MDAYWGDDYDDDCDGDDDDDDEDNEDNADDDDDGPEPSRSRRVPFHGLVVKKLGSQRALGRSARPLWVEACALLALVEEKLGSQGALGRFAALLWVEVCALPLPSRGETGIPRSTGAIRWTPLGRGVPPSVNK